MGPGLGLMGYRKSSIPPMTYFPSEGNGVPTFIKFQNGMLMIILLLHGKIICHHL